MSEKVKKMAASTFKLVFTSCLTWFVFIQVPQRIPCYIFQQDNPPANYDPVRFGPWEPVNVLLVPEIPSKHTGSKQYSVVVMYVPTSQPIVHHNWMGYRQYETARIKAVCCGRSQANSCPVGARTVSPCAHGGTTLFAGCCLANNPGLFKSTHSTLNMLDPGSGLPLQYAVDLLAGAFS